MDRISPIALIATCVLVALPALNAARAEGFVDLRVGGAFTEDNDVEFTRPGGGGSVEFPTEYEDSVTGGVRGGYWFESLPWLGLAADVSYFAPDDDTSFGAEYDVIPLSPLLMGRVPIATSEEFPHGRVQPFIGVGPGIFVSLADFGAGADADNGEGRGGLHPARGAPSSAVGPGISASLAAFGAGADDDTVEVGADLHAGLNVQVTRM